MEELPDISAVPSEQSPDKESVPASFVLNVNVGRLVGVVGCVPTVTTGVFGGGNVLPEIKSTLPPSNSLVFKSVTVLS
jgi:hypothetical protein